MVDSSTSSVMLPLAPAGQRVEARPVCWTGLTGCTETSVATIEAAFAEFVDRPDIAIILINQHVRLAFSTVEARARADTGFTGGRDDSSDRGEVRATVPGPARDSEQGPPVRFVHPLSS